VSLHLQCRGVGSGFACEPPPRNGIALEYALGRWKEELPQRCLSAIVGVGKAAYNAQSPDKAVVAELRPVLTLQAPRVRR
jgi:hypothetical protein